MSSLLAWEISSRSFYSCWVIFQDEQRRPVGANLIFPQEELSSQSRQHQSVTFLLSMERAFYFWQLRKLPIKLFRAVTIPAPALGWKWHQTEISGLFSSPQSWFPAVKCSNARNPRAGNYERTPREIRSVCIWRFNKCLCASNENEKSEKKHTFTLKAKQTHTTCEHISPNFLYDSYSQRWTQI